MCPSILSTYSTTVLHPFMCYWSSEPQSIWQETIQKLTWVLFSPEVPFHIGTTLFSCQAVTNLLWYCHNPDEESHMAIAPRQHYGNISTSSVSKVLFISSKRRRTTGRVILTLCILGCHFSKTHSPHLVDGEVNRDGEDDNDHQSFGKCVRR